MRFVIDLNVFRCAWNGVSPYGTAEQDSATLILQIVRKGHQIIVTREIDRIYGELFDELRNASRQGPASLNVVHLYYLAKQTSLVDDSRCSADLPELPEESKIKDEDKNYAVLSGITRAVLVTFDDPLIQECAKIGINACRPEQALVFADP